MFYIFQHLKNIIEAYDGQLPLTHFLKNYFRSNPKLGSRDRKIINEAVYSYYRVAKGLSAELSVEDAIKYAVALCSNRPEIAKYLLDEEWNKLTELSLQERLKVFEKKGVQFEIEKLFPFDIKLSSSITRQEWLQSMMEQPRLFIRVRKNKEKVLSLLHDNNIEYKEISDNCISLPNNSPVDKILAPETYVVQDASSQRTGDYFHPEKNEQWWDACSGAGGKSLLLKDMEPAVKLTVSDKRKSILYNLQNRFHLYSHTIPEMHVLDAANEAETDKELKDKGFDAIICDVPCSGSGTWARTPEQLYFFNPENLQNFTSIQPAIAINASKYLKDGGTLYYITCSIFEQENEAIVNMVSEASGLQLKEQSIIKGTEIYADSMFIAVLKKGN